MLNRRDFLKKSILGSIALMAGQGRGAETAGTGRNPNVIVLLVDDLGYGDVGGLLRQVVSTPNIDRLAKKGVKFTDGYASCPLCAPSRAGFLTGRYQQGFGVENNGSETIPREVPTFAEIFKQAGYATGLLGKWHSGTRDGFRPYERGFDEFYGYYGPFLNYRAPKLYRKDKLIEEKEYSSDVFAREAEDFIERHKGVHFFLNVAFNAPHIVRVIKGAGEIERKFRKSPDIMKQSKPGELKAPMSRVGEDEKFLKQFDNDWPRADTVACITALDQAVGRILDKLEKAGLDRNTVVFFFSDNGGHPENRSENLPLRDYKWSVHEGGMRIPFFASYPGVLPEGLTYQQPVMSIDILPTCAALAGVSVPAKLDGVNLVPFLKGEKKNAPHEALYWRIDSNHAIRKGRWKLVMESPNPLQLFDMENDSEEKNDLAEKNPEVVSRLKKDWDAWNAQVEENLSTTKKSMKLK